MTDLPMLKNGSKAPEVKGLKNALMVRLHDFHLFDRPLSEDFGPKTEKAVERFQKEASLHADGIVGPKTWDALGVYVVRSGDTLSGIAREHLGDEGRWSEIFDVNRELISDPDQIFPGQVLTLPEVGC